MNKPNECNSRHLDTATATDGQDKTGSQGGSICGGKPVANGGHRLQGFSAGGSRLGSSFGSKPLPDREQVGCGHDEVTLRTAHGAWICMACADTVERRSPLGASVPRFASFLARSLSA